MSTDYSAGIAIGYRIPLSAIRKRTKRRVPEKSHMRPYFNSLSGAREPDVKVIDQEAHRVLDWEGHSYEDERGPEGGIDDLLSAIASKCGCVYITYGLHEDRVSGLPIYVVFGPKFAKRAEMDARHNFSIGGSILVSDVVEQRKAMREIGRKLRDLGFKTGHARIFTDWDWG